MKGTIKNYLHSKQYGFIKGEDGNDYFFHSSSFKNKQDIQAGALVEFKEKLAPKGFKASACELLPVESIDSFEVPDKMIVLHDVEPSPWEIIEASSKEIHVIGRGDPQIQRDLLFARAKELGANALVNYRRFATTGSESGKGNGTHHFTLHNFKATPVTVGRRTVIAGAPKESLKGLDVRVQAKAQELKEMHDEYESKKSIHIASGIAFSLGFGILFPLLGFFGAIITALSLPKKPDAYWLTDR
ncbi:cold-shock protein [Vibrio owensii]|uniref:cold-shock protein n=1 Tax=Vibrio owensii TaxID=696485 RepID=UPI003CC554CE